MLFYFDAYFLDYNVLHEEEPRKDWIVLAQ